MVPIIKSPVGRLAPPALNMESSNPESLALNSQAGVDRPAYVLLWQLRRLWHMHGRASPSSKAWRFFPKDVVVSHVLFISASYHYPCLSHSGLGWDGFEMLWGQMIMVTTSNSNHHKASPAAKTPGFKVSTKRRACKRLRDQGNALPGVLIRSTWHFHVSFQLPMGIHCRRHRQETSASTPQAYVSCNLRWILENPAPSFSLNVQLCQAWLRHSSVAGNYQATIPWL